MTSSPEGEGGASGKHRVSTRISRAHVICPRASFVPENLWEEITRARHLVNDARICGTNFWREMTRASKFSKLPHFQNFVRFSKFCPIFKFLPNFQNRDPKSQKGPYRDPGPKIGTLLRSVGSHHVIHMAHKVWKRDFQLAQEFSKIYEINMSNKHFLYMYLIIIKSNIHNLYTVYIHKLNNCSDGHNHNT